ncbi:uncharacterized protein LOC129229387 [Uloborus diversus]|uniref:uncharacterized protein LOC129229387 n=1 Tax=Uloborus diversus TaxID=327109 RepID=UPI00240A4B35|nr:uncharacterized protein LOC129229387 [Uloborus diversus]
MNTQNLSSLFNVFKCNVKNLTKTCYANSYLSKSKGTRKVEKARKYKRPEDLEDPQYYGIGPKEEVKALFKSLLNKGFAKEQVSYSPPKELEPELLKICKKVFGTELGSDWKNQSLTDPVIKYKLLTKAIQQFKKDVPNSELHKMKEVGDLLSFLSMPVDGCYHYDRLARDSEQLPPNLHIMPDTPEFNPETDTFFNGITAYPGRKRLIHTKLGEKFEKTIEWPHI